MKFKTFRLLAVLVCVALFAVGTATAQAQATQRCFQETGFCVSGRLLQYWNANGGLPVFGLPVSPQRAEQSASGTFEAQWFERARLELHPEAKAPYDVQLGRLGVDALVKQGRDWFSLPKFDPNQADAENCRLFRETEHTVCNEFLTAFRSYGLSFPSVGGISDAESLALFGLPISQPMTETTPDGKQLQVQWFERARFELHPANTPPYNVLFGRLGAELVGPVAVPPVAALPTPTAQPQASALFGTWQLVASGPVNAPTLPITSGQPVRLTFDAEGQFSGNTGCNAFASSYQADSKQITFGQIITTLVACTPQELNQQQTDLFAVLTGSRTYERTTAQLKIFYDNNASALIYQALPTVTGTVSYRERIALPAGATIVVELQDVSRADAPATVISRQVIQANGKQVPFSFALAYDPTQINPNGTYVVRATIRVGDQLQFTTTQAYQVITKGNPTKVDLVLSRA